MAQQVLGQSVTRSIGQFSANEVDDDSLNADAAAKFSITDERGGSRIMRAG